MAQTLGFLNINTVPGAYLWTADKQQKAGKDHYFINVGKGDKVTKRYITGAKAKWDSPDPTVNSLIYHTGYRISGLPQDVRLALKYAKESDDTIDQVLATSLTKDNYQTTMASVYQEEMAAYKASQGTKPSSKGYEWVQILWFADNIKNAVIAKKSGGDKGRVASPSRAGSSETLQEKVRKIVDNKLDKVVNVSGFDPITGKGGRVIPPPKTHRAGLFGSTQIPIVSNDITKYIRALQLLYGENAETEFAKDIKLVREAIELNAASAKASTKSSKAPAPAPAPAPVPQPSLPKMPSPNSTAVPQIKTPGRAPVQTVGGASIPAMPPFRTLVQ